MWHPGPSFLQHLPQSSYPWGGVYRLREWLVAAEYAIMNPPQ